MNKAIFLDRDGVINYERGQYTFIPQDFILNKNLMETLLFFSEKGYILIVISNQGGIAKKLYSKEQVDFLHSIFLNECKRFNIEISDFLYCPHHNDIENCLCRKPKTLLLEKAIIKYNINPEKSYFIGDNKTDEIAAKKLKINSITIMDNDLSSIEWKKVII